jgi:hypothetical protein
MSNPRQLLGKSFDATQQHRCLDFSAASEQ